jgi:transketolase N-terminal domain/subunit
MIKVQQEGKESTIIIKNDLRERLKKFGYKGQTYNDIIAKLLDSNFDDTDSSDRRFNPKSNESSSSTME